MAKENVPNPVNESRPTKTRVPMPAARSPGTRTRPSIGPPSPTASMRRNAPAMGEPKSVLMAAKLPAAAMTVMRGGGSFPPGQAHGDDAQRSPDGDERGLGPEDDTEAQRGQSGHEYAGEVDRAPVSRRP